MAVGYLDEITEDLVVLYFQRRDAGLGFFAFFHGRDDLLGVVADGAEFVQFLVIAFFDDLPGGDGVGRVFGDRFFDDGHQFRQRLETAADIADDVRFDNPGFRFAGRGFFPACRPGSAGAAAGRCSARSWNSTGPGRRKISAACAPRCGRSGSGKIPRRRPGGARFLFWRCSG